MLVQEYAERNFTFDTDVINAFARIGSAVNCISDDCVAYLLLRRGNVMQCYSCQLVRLKMAPRVEQEREPVLS
jgi:hypothetical protein